VHEVHWKKSVSKDLKHIAKGHRDKLVNNIIQALSKNPKKGKKLSGKFDGLYDYRLGDYRAVYAIIPKGVLVLRVRHRKNAYK